MRFRLTTVVEMAMSDQEAMENFETVDAEEIAGRIAAGAQKALEHDIHHHAEWRRHYSNAVAHVDAINE